MFFEQFILWLIFNFGSAYIITTSKLFEKLRNKLKKDTLIHYLFNCLICASVWISFFSSFYFSPSAIFEIPFFLQIILNMGIQAGISFIITNALPTQFE